MNCDPNTGKIPQWRFNPAEVDRMMPDMLAPMSVTSRAVWDRLVAFAEAGADLDLCLNLHQGGRDNFWGVYELADPVADNFLEDVSGLTYIGEAIARLVWI
jgi:hypothetical protein